jgi:hypothetical protein
MAELIKNPVDRGFLNSDLGCAVEIDEIPNFNMNLVKAEFERKFPQYEMDGFKGSDELCPENRMFLLYQKTLLNDDCDYCEAQDCPTCNPETHDGYKENVVFNSLWNWYFETNMKEYLECIWDGFKALLFLPLVLIAMPFLLIDAYFKSKKKKDSKYERLKGDI